LIPELSWASHLKTGEKGRQNRKPEKENVKWKIGKGEIRNRNLEKRDYRTENKKKGMQCKKPEKK